MVLRWGEGGQERLLSGLRWCTAGLPLLFKTCGFFDRKSCRDLFFVEAVYRRLGTLQQAAGQRGRAACADGTHSRGNVCCLVWMLLGTGRFSWRCIYTSYHACELLISWGGDGAVRPTASPLEHDLKALADANVG